MAITSKSCLSCWQAVAIAYVGALSMLHAAIVCMLNVIGLTVALTAKLMKIRHSVHSGQCAAHSINAWTAGMHAKVLLCCCYIVGKPQRVQCRNKAQTHGVIAMWKPHDEVMGVGQAGSFLNV